MRSRFLSQRVGLRTYHFDIVDTDTPVKIDHVNGLVELSLSSSFRDFQNALRECVEYEHPQTPGAQEAASLASAP